MGTNHHTGYVHISKGALMIQNGALTGGRAEIDMNTIEDENHGRNNGLVRHLKNPDFFEVNRFPVSTIEITRVEPGNDDDIKVTGNLTIKGVTHAVTFPASSSTSCRLSASNESKTSVLLPVSAIAWLVNF